MTSVCFSIPSHVVHYSLRSRNMNKLRDEVQSTQRTGCLVCFLGLLTCGVINCIWGCRNKRYQAAMGRWQAEFNEELEPLGMFCKTQTHQPKYEIYSSVTLTRSCLTLWLESLDVFGSGSLA